MTFSPSTDYYSYRSDTTPNDPWFGDQWGMFLNCSSCEDAEPHDINARKAWDITTGSDEIVAAVIDTGVYTSHTDLAPNIWRNPSEIADNGIDDDGNGFVDDINGWNFHGNNNQVFKDNETDYHGTHVAGTIGAVGNNEIGVAGVAWNVKLMSLKFIGRRDGAGLNSHAIKAIKYAIAQKRRGTNIKLINASWGGPGASRALREAIAEAGEAGILFVCAAGNEGVNVDQVPSYPVGWTDKIPTMISVAATLWTGLADFSNYSHHKVSVAAPGRGIISTDGHNHYLSLDGTSMATPHVSGVAVLVWAQEPSLTPVEVKQRIVSTAKTSVALISRIASAGYLDAHAALTNTIAPPHPPRIVRIRLEKKAVIIDGLGFLSGSSVLEVNGVALSGTVYDESYKISNGSLTRLIIKPGKKVIKNTFPLGQGFVLTVLNQTTGERSPLYEWANNP